MIKLVFAGIAFIGLTVSVATVKVGYDVNPSQIPLSQVPESNAEGGFISPTGEPVVVPYL